VTCVGLCRPRWIGWRAPDRGVAAPGSAAVPCHGEAGHIPWARASRSAAPTRPEPALLKNPYAEIKKQGGAGVSLAKLKRQG